MSLLRSAEISIFPTRTPPVKLPIRRQCTIAIQFCIRSPDGYKGKDARRGGGTYPNLLDAHSPFQIDGNFGGCAGVIEMLMQSSENSITLLPALPEEWKDGSVKGICARGGFIVDMEWKDNKVTSLYIQSRKGGKTKVCFNGKVKNITLKGGKGIKLL